MSRIVKKINDCQGMWQARMERTTGGHGVYFESDTNVPELDVVIDV